MVLCIGDVHRDEVAQVKAAKAVFKNKSPEEENYLIVLGDFGLIWTNRDKEEQWWKEWYGEMPFTTLFLDGNHDCFDRLFSDEFKKVKMFGSQVKKISDKVFYLQRGHIYNIQGYDCFIMGGGESIDKNRRIDGVSWWKQEMPNKAEMDLGLSNLEKHNNKVDYILSHTCSNKMFNVISEKYDMIHKEGFEKSLRDYFDHIEDTVDFVGWYFGHYHIDEDLDDKHSCAYDRMLIQL